MTMTDTPSLMQVALAAHDAGMSIIPVRSDGKKKPAVPWKQYQTERATKEQVRAWFAPGQHQAAAVVCGQVSGWLVMIEMEGWAFDAGLWQQFREEAVERLGEDRWATITRYVERSPSGGVHIYVRCPDYEIGNVKLAMRDHDGEHVVAMETRGEGGYSIIAGSIGHPSGRGWEVATPGVLADIATVSHGELDIILAAARTLNATVEQVPPAPPSAETAQPAPVSAGGEGVVVAPSPPSAWMDDTIADFNADVDILSWLHDWSVAGDDSFNGEHVRRLHRAGSDNDHGAVLFDSGRVGFFSSNCPRWADAYDGSKMATYDAFAVYCAEEFGGNDTATRVRAARHLRTLGYGPEPEPISASDETAEDPDTGENEPGPILPVRWVDEAIADPPPEPDVLVKGLLRRGEITVLGAPRAIGKTWAAFNLANICARGDGYLFGSALYEGVVPAKVLYLQGELGKWGSASRWAALPHETPAGMVAETFERIRIRTTNRTVVTTIDGSTYHDSHVDAVVDHRLEAAIVEGGFDVLIIDPWATFFAGNENANDETEAALAALTDIARRCNIAILIVHHITNKTDRGVMAEPEDLWRGASRLADAVSTRMTVLPYYTPKAAAEIGMPLIEARKHVKVSCLERNGPSPEMIFAKREGFWWQAWVPPVIGRPEEVTTMDVVTILRGQPGQMVPSKRRLAALIGKSHSAVDRVTELCLAQGLIEECAGAHGAIGYRLIAEL